MLFVSTCTVLKADNKFKILNLQSSGFVILVKITALSILTKDKT